LDAPAADDARGLTALDGTHISYYVMHMGDQETIGGTPVTEEQIAAWAAEAEAGYDVDALKRRGRGRPGRGASPSQVVTVRLTPAEIEAVDAKAAAAHMSRSEYIRSALAGTAA
jgi:predicted transcriptional regulator